MTGISRRSIFALAAMAAFASAGTSFTSALADTAPPPQDCDTPNQSGGTGIMLTPANPNTSGQQYLTKTYVSYSSAGGAYAFAVKSLRPSGTTFSELIDCAYTTIGLSGGGTPQMPGYSHQQNNPSFTFQATCPTGTGSCWTFNFPQSVNNQSSGAPDAICDRVQIKGVDGTSGLPFTDYSNLVQSNNASGFSLAASAIMCGSTAQTPETPVTAILAGAGLVVIAGAFLYSRRRTGAAAA